MSRKITWLHISDIHFLPKNDWLDNESRRTLLQQLDEIFATHPALRPDFIFCTGDIGFGELKKSPLADQYLQAEAFFDRLLVTCGLPSQPLSKERLFVVPGNHDVDRGAVNSDAQSAIIAKAADSTKHEQEMNERFHSKSIEFLDAIKRQKQYSNFIAKYLAHLSDADERNFFHRKISVRDVEVEMVGFNSAWTAAGPEDDRSLWLAAQAQFALAAKNYSSSAIRIGLIHHPTDWLTLADRQVTTARVQSDFDFWLHGHTHETWVTPTATNITIGAGAIGAETADEFGFNITTIDLDSDSGQSHLYSKQRMSVGWTIHPIAHHAPYGIWKFKLPQRSPLGIAKGQFSSPADTIGTGIQVISASNAPRLAQISEVLRGELTNCLRSYNSQPDIWVEPIVSLKPESSQGYRAAGAIDLELILAGSSNLLIVAPPQFGLTCLLTYLCLSAWERKKRLWIYLNLESQKPNKSRIVDLVADRLKKMHSGVADIQYFVVDGGSNEKDFLKCLKILSELYPHVPMLCAYRRSDVVDIVPVALIQIRDFQTAYLWSLSRSQIREVVACYNRETYIGEEDLVTARLSSDLEVLNLHRTPLNCLTLLKVSEIDFDENPVNRSEMIKRILFIIFNIDAVPTYKRRPDLKDCEYVLGYFCQSLIQSDGYRFARSQFISDIQGFCQKQLIDLDINFVFDVLVANNIIVAAGSQFAFRFSYWILYFAAQRMHHDEEFAAFIMGEARYAQYPEIIEFYTGIDRKKEGALRLISKDLREAAIAVNETCGLPEGLNPYRLDIWKASDEGAKKMQQVVAEGVRESTLPDEIKDQLADARYDPTRPYDQTLENFLTQNSVASLFKLIQAASRALRNSDYAAPDTKRALLADILSAWEQLSRVVLVILPILSVDRRATIDGQTFNLIGSENGTPAEVALAILKAIPRNIVNWFSDDIYSQKMSPLLLERVSDAEAPDLSRHELALLVAGKRPRNWEKALQKYISSVRKDSYYLMDLFSTLQHQYSVGYASPATLREIEHLIKMAATKHLTGNKDPGVKAIEKMKFAPGILPDRTSSAGED